MPAKLAKGISLLSSCKAHLRSPTASTRDDLGPHPASLIDGSVLLDSSHHKGSRTDFSDTMQGKCRPLHDDIAKYTPPGWHKEDADLSGMVYDDADSSIMVQGICISHQDGTRMMETPPGQYMMM